MNSGTEERTTPRVRRCPACKDIALQAALTRGGIGVDRCPACGGVWLDRGEIFEAALEPADAVTAMADAECSSGGSGLVSPVGAEAMERLRYRGEVELLRCPRTAGFWISGEALRKLKRIDPGIELDTADEGPRPVASARGALRKLPSLALSAATSFAMLYASLGLLLLLVAEDQGLDSASILAMAAGILAAQFVLSPWLMDLYLRALFKMRWTGLEGLPPRMRAFIERVCAERGVPPPSIGLIEDGAPQAFTYGHSPRNARIVLSTGLIDLLAEEEAEAVVAHEIGHAVHWDMLLMTAAQFVPFVAYTIFRALSDASKDNSNNKEKDGGNSLAVIAYLVYFVSNFVVLYLSRTREYHADRFAGEVTGDPGRLARALVKIGYGLAGREAEAETPASDRDERSAGAVGRSTKLYAVGALGIFDRASAKSLAITAPLAAGASPDAAKVRKAMRWDLWNPWARWYELTSTHPLVARRLSALADQALHMGKEPYAAFDLRRPRSYRLEFAADLALLAMPWIAALASLVLALRMSGDRSAGAVISPVLIATGLALLIRLDFTHPTRRFTEMSIAALLSFVTVSAVRPVPCILRGAVVGRGVPGLVFSEDFVLRDDTGILFLDYRQPLRIWEFLFGVLKAKDFTGKEAVVTGWFRRTSVPYLEIRTIESEGRVWRSYTLLVSRVFAVALVIAGVASLGALATLSPGEALLWLVDHIPEPESY